MPNARELLPVLLFEKQNKIKGGIYNIMQVNFAYNSNHIEGSWLSHDQTRYIYETHTIDGVAPVNDVFEAANHFKCFDHILDTISEPITEEYRQTYNAETMSFKWYCTVLHKRGVQTLLLSGIERMANWRKKEPPAWRVSLNARRYEGGSWLF